MKPPWVPLTLKAASQLVDELDETAFVSSALEGYSCVERERSYGDISQR
ncbi:MAG: hypothetical protein AAF892_02070 [Cyanobacteria bacterium P01_D01_bin.71]